MLSGLKKYLALGMCFTLLACEQQPNSPHCRVNSNYQHNSGTGGACLLVAQNNVLVLQNKDGTYDLPFRKKFTDESSQCAAHRGTWLDTGINVSVGTALVQQRSGIWIYACNMDLAGFDGSELSIPVPEWSHSDNRQLVFIDMFDVTLHDWQRPDEFIATRDAFTRHQNYLREKTSPQ